MLLLLCSFDRCTGFALDRLSEKSLFLVCVGLDVSCLSKVDLSTMGDMSGL